MGGWFIGALRGGQQQTGNAFDGPISIIAAIAAAGPTYRNMYLTILLVYGNFYGGLILVHFEWVMKLEVELNRDFRHFLNYVQDNFKRSNLDCSQNEFLALK